MLANLFPELYRRYLLKQTDKPVLKQYLQVPLAKPAQSIYDTAFLALDLETTGLNPEQDEILSVGYTVIRQGRILLRENNQLLIKPEQAIKHDSVTIHGITDAHAEKGISVTEMLEQILPVLAGKVLLAHHAEIERKFLNQACLKYAGSPLPVRTVDTLKIAQRSLQQRQQLPGAGQLRLFNLRQQYGLPRYKAHNALEDAIATAELFLAIVHNRCSRIDHCRLGEFL